MFTRDILIRGKHARYMQELSPRNSAEDRTFDRYIDVYLNAAIVGFIYGIKESRDTSTNDSANMLLDTISKERNNLKFVYETIMLLDNKNNLPDEERLNNAFRNHHQKDSQEHIDNFEAFNSYVRGGITYLYENISHNALDKEKRVENINNFIEDFYNEFVLDKFTEDIVYD